MKAVTSYIFNAQPTPTQPSRKTSAKTNELYGEADLWGFEPQYPAPKAGRISRLPHRPIIQKGIVHLLYNLLFSMFYRLFFFL
jgi:hypothetical protein